MLMEKLFLNTTDAFKIIASYMIGGIAVAFCIYTAWSTALESAKYLQVLICIVGGALGWILGLLLTPSSEGEKKQFSEWGKAFAALVSGFGLAQITTLIEWARTGWQGANSETGAIRALLFACTLLIGGLVTYISRLHVRGTADEERARREKILSELFETLEKLRRAN
jgi:hypothetical protein